MGQRPNAGRRSGSGITDGDGGRPRAVGDSELGQDCDSVDGHGPPADEECRGKLRNSPARGHQAQHLPLSRRNPYRAAGGEWRMRPNRLLPVTIPGVPPPATKNTGDAASAHGPGGTTAAARRTVARRHHGRPRRGGYGNGARDIARQTPSGIGDKQPRNVRPFAKQRDSMATSRPRTRQDRRPSIR
jgi:hypothetical protein